METKQKSIKKGQTDKSQSKRSKSQKIKKSHSEVYTKDMMSRSSKAPTKGKDERSSCSSHNFVPSSDENSTEGNDDKEDLGSTDEDGEYKVNDLCKTLGRIMTEKESHSGLASWIHLFHEAIEELEI